MPAIRALVPDIPVRGLLGCRVLLRCSTRVLVWLSNDLTQLTLVWIGTRNRGSSVPLYHEAVREAEEKVASRAAA